MKRCEICGDFVGPPGHDEQGDCLVCYRAIEWVGYEMAICGIHQVSWPCRGRSEVTKTTNQEPA